MNEIRRDVRLGSRQKNFRSYLTNADISSIRKSYFRKLKKLEKKIKKYERRRKFMITTFDKAIVALLVPALVLALGHFGFKADQGFTDALAAVLTGILVWLVPNKE